MGIEFPLSVAVLSAQVGLGKGFCRVQLSIYGHFSSSKVAQRLGQFELHIALPDVAGATLPDLRHCAFHR